MTDRRFVLADVVLLLLVLLTAAGTRAGYLWSCANLGHSAGSLQVQDGSPLLAEMPPGTEMNGHSPPSELDALASNLKEHNWFGSLAPLAPQEERTAHIAPGYPYLVSLIARLPVERDFAVRWLQVALGTLTAGLYFLVGRRAFQSRTVGVVAGLLCALHPFWIVSCAEIEDGVLASFLLGLALWLGVRAGQSGGAFTALLYGVTLAGLALTRAALLPFAFLAVLWFVFRCRSLPRGWLFALLAFLGFANGLVPWGMRNFQATQQIVPVVDSVWLHLWIGNNPRATGGPQSETVLLQALADERGKRVDQVATEMGVFQQTDRYGRLSDDVVNEVQRNKVATIQRRYGAALAFVFGEKWFADRRPWRENDSEAPEWVSNVAPPVLLVWLLGFLLLAALGWRWSYAWAKQSMPIALAVIWIPLPYVLSHAESLHGPRLPIDGVLLCFAAVALVGLIPRVGTALRRGPGEVVKPE
jgi:4-amino-4-deoxy-L-arabinose transferase-like glycosyltransferase